MTDQFPDLTAHHDALEAVVAGVEGAFPGHRADRVRAFAGRIHDELDAIAQDLVKEA